MRMAAPTACGEIQSNTDVSSFAVAKATIAAGARSTSNAFCAMIVNATAMYSPYGDIPKLEMTHEIPPATIYPLLLMIGFNG